MPETTVHLTKAMCGEAERPSLESGTGPGALRAGTNRYRSGRWTWPPSTPARTPGGRTEQRLPPGGRAGFSVPTRDLNRGTAAAMAARIAGL